MKRDWVLTIPRTKWRGETAGYATRIAGLKLVTPELLGEFERMPDGLTFKPSNIVSVKYRGIVYANQLFGSAAEVVRSVQLLWPDGHFLCAVHCVRLLYEVWGGLRYFGDKILARASQSNDEARLADERLQRLMLGTNSAVLLPAGLTERYSPVSVQNFVDAGELHRKGFKAEYEFLCDISHPTYMHQNLYMMTADFMWSDEATSAEVHKTLERATKAAEEAVKGTVESMIEVYRECVPDIEKAIAENAVGSGSEA